VTKCTDTIHSYLSVFGRPYELVALMIPESVAFVSVSQGSENVWKQIDGELVKSVQIQDVLCAIEKSDGKEGLFVFRKL